MSLLRRRLSSAAHANFHDKYAKATTSVQNVPLGGITVNPNLKLSDVIRTEKLEGLSVETIAEIWRKHFEKKPLVASLAVAEAPFSLWWHHRARESPTFVVPLKVGEGVCNFMVQHQARGSGGYAVFATLDDYQRYREAAPVRLVAHCFGDLLEPKRVGLLKGQFDGDLIARQQAVSLLQNCISLYTTGAYRWVRTFNHSPQDFSYDSFLAYFSDWMTKSEPP